MEVTKELVVNGYVDASFDTDPDDSKSQTRYVFISCIRAFSPLSVLHSGASFSSGGHFYLSFVCGD